MTAIKIVVLFIPKTLGIPGDVTFSPPSVQLLTDMLPAIIDHKVVSAGRRLRKPLHYKVGQT